MDLFSHRRLRYLFFQRFLNTNGEKNVYTYKIKLGALVDDQQFAGDYTGGVNIGIQMNY